MGRVWVVEPAILSPGFGSATRYWQAISILNDSQNGDLLEVRPFDSEFEMEAVMPTDNVHRLAQLTRQLSETLVTAAYCADEIRTLVHIEPVHDQGANDHARSTSGSSANGRPLLDQSTFSVTWNGKSLRLGHTRSFWLLARLARRPNQYVTHLDLLNEVWDDEELTTGTIRSTVCQLRRRLRGCGMRTLATAIRGHNGHYILVV